MRNISVHVILGKLKTIVLFSFKLIAGGFVDEKVKGLNLRGSCTSAHSCATKH